KLKNLTTLESGVKLLFLFPLKNPIYISFYIFYKMFDKFGQGEYIKPIEFHFQFFKNGNVMRVESYWKFFSFYFVMVKKYCILKKARV
ncbi:MAG: hypothetical protein ACRC6H_09355, partial [Culicoidibacterales bacterium]